MKYFFILFLPACVLCPPATNCKRTVALRWAESLQLLFNLFPSLRLLSIWAFWWACELDQWEQQEKIRGGGSWGLRCVQWYPVIPKDAYCGCCYDYLCSVCVAFLTALLECTFYLILKDGSRTDLLPCVWIVYSRHEQTTARGPYATR